MEHEHFWSVSVCLTCSDEKSGKELIEQTRLQTLKEAIDVVNKEYDDTWNGAQGNFIGHLEDYHNSVIKKLEDAREA